jgi:hypothetical protein
VSITRYTRFVAKRSFERLTERYTHILDRVMTVDFKIARGLERQIPARVYRERCEHVIKKTYTCAHADFAPSIDVERGRYVRLLCLAFYLCTTHIFPSLPAICPAALGPPGQILNVEFFLAKSALTREISCAQIQHEQ